VPKDLQACSKPSYALRVPLQAHRASLKRSASAGSACQKICTRSGRRGTRSTRRCTRTEKFVGVQREVVRLQSLAARVQLGPVPVEKILQACSVPLYAYNRTLHAFRRPLNAYDEE